MIVRPLQRWNWLRGLWAVWFLGASALGDRVELRGVEAQFCEHPNELTAVIDGVDTGRAGWSVYPRTTEKSALMVSTTEPVQAQAFELTFCFLSGLPGRYWGDFAISYTSDTRPSLKGQWLPIAVERSTATGTTLTAVGANRFLAAPSDRMIGDAIFQVRMQAPPEAITGFRVEVLPFRAPDSNEERVAWSEYHDFCLTEFRVEAIRTHTTNVALGAPVRASHPLWAGLSASVLTDGLPGSFNHPAQSGLGQAFFFEIDLGSVRFLDHLALRGRADGYGMDRFSRLRVCLYERAPALEGAPVWEAMDRADGSYPAAGEVDILHASMGKGTFRGRYLRLSSDSPVALSPQIAEVEAYERLTPRLEGIQADGRRLSELVKIT